MASGARDPARHTSICYPCTGIRNRHCDYLWNQPCTECTRRNQQKGPGEGQINFCPSSISIDQWCRDRGLAPLPPVTASQNQGGFKQNHGGFNQNHNRGGFNQNHNRGGSNQIRGNRGGFNQNQPQQNQNGFYQNQPNRGGFHQNQQTRGGFYPNTYGPANAGYQLPPPPTSHRGRGSTQRGRWQHQNQYQHGNYASRSQFAPPQNFNIGGPVTFQGNGLVPASGIQGLRQNQNTFGLRERARRGRGAVRQNPRLQEQLSRQEAEREQDRRRRGTHYRNEQEVYHGDPRPFGQPPARLCENDVVHELIDRVQGPEARQPGRQATPGQRPASGLQIGQDSTTDLFPEAGTDKHMQPVPSEAPEQQSTANLPGAAGGLQWLQSLPHGLPSVAYSPDAPAVPDIKYENDE